MPDPGIHKFKSISCVSLIKNRRTDPVDVVSLTEPITLFGACIQGWMKRSEMVLTGYDGQHSEGWEADQMRHNRAGCLI